MLNLLGLESSLFGSGPNLGIDLGTSNTPVAEKSGPGITLREPSMVAIDRRAGKVIAVGRLAREMEGRTPAHIQVVRPIREGVVADYDVAEAMLRHLLSRVSPRLQRPRVLLGVPVDATEVERRAVSEAAREAGARSVYTLPQPLVAAVGAGLNVLDARGTMVVDVGGGTSEAAVISLGGMVASGCIRSAGDRMDQALIQYFRRSHNLLVGQRTAEQLKLDCGAARPPEQPLRSTVRGRDLHTGLPRQIQVEAEDTCPVLGPILEEIADLVRATLETTPPELVSHVVESGIVLCGGGALLRGLDDYLSEAVGVRCYPADDPLSCVALGARRLLNDQNLLKALMASHGARVG